MNWLASMSRLTTPQASEELYRLSRQVEKLNKPIIKLKTEFEGCADAAQPAAVQEINALLGADTIILPADHYRLSLPGAGADAAATEIGIESWPPSISENHATPS